MENKKRKKILITLADVGNGHRSAANALIKAFENLNLIDKYDIKVIDLFELADVQPFNTSDQTHTLVSRNKVFEGLNNLIFQLFDSKIGYSLFHDYTMALMKKECTLILQDEDPDLVISVHPIISMIVGEIKRSSPKQFKFATVITDLVTVFKGWGDPNADLIIAPTKEAFDLLIKRGGDSSKIEYPFFPINPSMGEFKAPKNTFKELGFKDKKPLITLTGGGVGTYSLKRAIRAIQKRTDCNILIICGKTHSLKAELESRFKNNPNIKILGYVNNIQDYFNASEIIIGKPGPATILEIEIFNKKAILTRPIGQQEKGNIAYALESPNFRYINENWDLLDSTITDLLSKNPQAEPRRNITETETIVKKVLELIN